MYSKMAISSKKIADSAELAIGIGHFKIATFSLLSCIILLALIRPCFVIRGFRCVAENQLFFSFMNCFIFFNHPTTDSKNVLCLESWDLAQLVKASKPFYWKGKLEGISKGVLLASRNPNSPSFRNYLLALCATQRAAPCRSSCLWDESRYITKLALLRVKDFQEVHIELNI